MSDKTITKRGIYLYINDKEIRNDVKSIRNEMADLTRDQAKMVIGSKQYIETGKKIKALDSILKEHRRQWRETTKDIDGAKKSFLSLGKISDAFNRYMGVITAFIASITGLTFAIRKAVDDFAEMEEAQAGVRKYTGMTTDQIKDLNEAFKKMDTRAARTRLNELAADAGRLGVQGKKDILEFVEAANIINVSLGEDLGEDAVKNIGKLAQMFGTSSEKGLKAGMLSVASAINEIGQTSSAAEAYIVDFTARVAGTGNQAGIAIPKIMGYASVLDQNMIRNEMAATALQKVWLAMYQEPAKFAKIAGKSMEEFTTMVQQDANEAFLTLLENLKGKNGLLELAPIFEELKLNGTEAIGVLTSLVNNVANIRKEQQTATKAFDEGTSVLNEYNVQNTTLQAEIEKAKKKFQEYTYILGEKLAPYMSNLISKSGLMIKGLSALFDWLMKYGITIVKLTAIIAAYTAAEKVKTLWMNKGTVATKAAVIATNAYKAAVAATEIVLNILKGRIFAAKIAMIAFNKVISVNPIGLLLSAITATGIAIATFISRQKEANKHIFQAQKEIHKETEETNRLFSALKAAGIGTEQRTRLIKVINEQYGDYLPNLLSESSTLNEIKEAQEAVNTAIRNNIALKTQKEAVDEIERKSLDKKADEIDDIRKLLKKSLPESEVETALAQIIEQTERAVNKGFSSSQALSGVFINLKKSFFGGDGSKLDKQTANQIEDYIDVVYDTAAKVMKEKEKYSPFISKAPKKNALPEFTVTAKGKGSPTPFVPDADPEEIKKEMETKTKALEDAYKAQVVSLKRQYIQRKITEEQMQRELFNIETLYLHNRKEILSQYGESTVDIESQITDKIIAETNRRKKERTRIEEEEEKPEENPLYAKLAKGNAVQQAMNQALYDNGLIDHEEYIRRKAELDEEYRKEKEAKDREAAERETQIRESVLGTMSSLANSAAQVMSAAQNKEIAAIEKKYKQKLILAEGDNEATAALEEAKDAEIMEVKKKYADKTFAMNVLSITADTAVAAMRAYSAMAGIPIVGPALGAAAAAAAVVAGAAQIAIANQQRQEAANMWEGGYTGEGGKYEKKKLIQTHGGEFVANKETVQVFRPAFDVMDYAQRTGNLALLKSPEMARALGMPFGSSSSSSVQQVTVGGTANTNPDVMRALAENTRMMNLLREKLNEPIAAEVSISGRKGVKKNLTDYDRLIKNATR